MIDFRPQTKQTEFLASSADIAIYGGAAGSGKTFAILLDPIRYFGIERNYNAVVFRRITKDITQAGGLWDTAKQIYAEHPTLDRFVTSPTHTIRGANETRIEFNHLQYDDTAERGYQGAQITGLYFDELTHFSAHQYWYLLGRNRNPACAVKPYCRATCNPDPDSFVRDLIDWWIDRETGYAIPERSGIPRWFIKNGETIEWEADPRLFKDREKDALSFTFISALLSDNKYLHDGGEYERRLKAQNTTAKVEQLLRGNWNIREEAGGVFKPDMIRVIDAPPRVKRKVRSWDLASIEGAGDYTAGVLLGLTYEGDAVGLDMKRGQWSSENVETIIRATAEQDGIETLITLPLDPGQAGKAQTVYFRRVLQGFNFKFVPPMKNKLIRARPFAATVNAGGFSMIRAVWNKPLLSEMRAFDGLGKDHDDQIDALSDAFAELANGSNFFMV